MTVSLTASKTLNGSGVTDNLAPTGSGNTGVDMGSAGTNSWTPLTNKTANQGHLNLYLRHDGVNDIQDLVTFIQQYGVGTSYTYGGADTAANDYAALKTLGFGSGSSKNQADGLSAGLWVDMNWQSNDSSRFDQANFPTNVKIYGDNNTDGIDLDSAFTVIAAAMVYDNGGTETSGSVPVDGTIGTAGNTVHGDNAHIKLRMYIPTIYSRTNINQFEWVASYTYTS